MDVISGVERTGGGFTALVNELTRFRGERESAFSSKFKCTPIYIEYNRLVMLSYEKQLSLSCPSSIATHACLFYTRNASDLSPRPPHMPRADKEVASLVFRFNIFPIQDGKMPDAWRRQCRTITADGSGKRLDLIPDSVALGHVFSTHKPLIYDLRTVPTPIASGNHRGGNQRRDTFDVF